MKRLSGNSQISVSAAGLGCRTIGGAFFYNGKVVNMSDRKTLLFTSIYNEYYALIFSTAYARLKNIEESREVSQEVFTRFLAKMPESGSRRRWLLSALNFVILEHDKKNKTADTDINVSDLDGMRGAQLIISEALNNPELFEDTNDKTLFDLIAIYRYTFKEAGTELDMTERLVKYRYEYTSHGIVDYLKMKGIS